MFAIARCLPARPLAARRCASTIFALPTQTTPIAAPSTHRRAVKNKASQVAQGDVVELAGLGLHRVERAQHVKKGRGSANVQMDLRSLGLGGSGGKKRQIRFRADEPVELAELTTTALEYVGEAADNDVLLVFEARDSGETVMLAKAALGPLYVWLREDDEVRVLSAEPLDSREIDDDDDDAQSTLPPLLSVSLPPQATAQVIDTAEQAAQASPTYKACTLDNGRTIKVPPHVKIGDNVVVKLPSEEYVSKF